MAKRQSVTALAVDELTGSRCCQFWFCLASPLRGAETFALSPRSFPFGHTWAAQIWDFFLGVGEATNVETKIHGDEILENPWCTLCTPYSWWCPRWSTRRWPFLTKSGMVLHDWIITHDTHVRSQEQSLTSQKNHELHVHHDTLIKFQWLFSRKIDIYGYIIYTPEKSQRKS